MIYRGLEFIDLKSEKISLGIFTILDFSYSEILDYDNYYTFLNKLFYSDKKDILICPINYIKKIIMQNNYTNEDSLLILDILMKCRNDDINNNLFGTLDISFATKPLLYFLTLTMINHHYYYSNFLEKYRNTSYNQRYKFLINYPHNIINYNDLLKNVENSATQDCLTTKETIIVKNIYNSNNIIVDQKTYTPFDFLQKYCTEKEIIIALKKFYKDVKIFCNKGLKDFVLYIYYYFVQNYHFKSQGYTDEKTKYFAYQHGLIFFHMFSYLIYPHTKRTENIKYLQDLFNIIKEMDYNYLQIVQYPFLLKDNVDSIDNEYLFKKYNYSKKSIHTNFSISNINLRKHINKISNKTAIIPLIADDSDNLISITKNIKNYNDLYRFLLQKTDEEIEQLGFYVLNTPMFNFLIRSYFFVKKNFHRIECKQLTIFSKIIYWNIVNFEIVQKYAKNKNDLTPSAIIARRFEGTEEYKEYKEYANETNLQLWESHSNYFLLFNLDNTFSNFYAFSIQQLLNNSDSQRTTLKFNDHRYFSNAEIKDLLSCLYDANCEIFDPLIDLLNDILNNQLIPDIYNFRHKIKELDTQEFNLLEQYFTCYFILLNYLRFWPGVPFEIFTRVISNKDTRIYARNEIVSLFLPVIQEYRELLAPFLGEDWDKNLLLMSQLNKSMDFKAYNIKDENGIQILNVNGLHDRLVLLSRNLFCAAIYCENAMLYINAIMYYVYYNETITTQNIADKLQSLCDRTVPSIMARFLEHNEYTKSIIAKKEQNIYNAMFDYYNSINNTMNENKIVPTFVENDTNLISVDNKLQIPIKDFHNCLDKLHLLDTNKSDEKLFHDAYRYYLNIYLYTNITTYLNGNYHFSIGDVEDYNNLYHSNATQDNNIITHYYTFV